MRLLLIHTDETIRSFLPDIIASVVLDAVEARDFEMRCEDGNQLDHEGAVQLLNAGYDCIIVNLRLPRMLSIRLAELVHLAKVPARLVLMSGAPEDLGPAVPLFDEYLRIPFSERSLPDMLSACLKGSFQAQQRALGSQEHLDIAILNLLHRCDSLAPGCRGALHAFGMYRDSYLHRPPTAWAEPMPILDASLSQRIHFFGSVTPLNFCQRLSQVSERVEHSKLLQPHQKSFLQAQFNHLQDAFGLTLMSCRDELEQVMRGLEQFGHMVERGIGASEVEPRRLRELLLSRSQPVPYVSQGISRIASLLPAIE